MRLPGWARAALSMVPLRDLRGDVEADLAELFGDRRARYGFVYAHRRLSSDILSLWRGSLRGGTMLRDLRFGLRLVRKHPAPVAIGIGGLALAIAAVTSVFTLIDATMLRPFGMQDPFSVGARRRSGPRQFFVLALSHIPASSGRGEPQPGRSVSVREGAVEQRHTSRRRPGPLDAVRERQLPRHVRARPVLGRALQPADDMPGAPAVIAVSRSPLVD